MTTNQPSSSSGHQVITSAPDEYGGYNDDWSLIKFPEGPKLTCPFKLRRARHGCALCIHTWKTSRKPKA
ncbi:hypothetical protein GLAREA_07405 [Glarea lozoyensis ATCC 20868]|uniref:Uncharacterized protein n=1 Tax=Glarea lozoyensis (strain ATCC 20868 / MF5171) TaxID=1116229 RepID=S3D189_GLAL2|nr:uncharacterized protein GLAREA_07405 [Glarea lozoyensis ATCC 20868]EPE32272.1 hypothetical protein GLAREA_07405 [Glarea lozoyensis ATCC 20868]